ncbi:glucose/galactose MFS transporter [Sphingosinicellaceae bacterium]|nr:glucose/galactose MFS transporter [Sphingosinicellaceae bacterium]
MGSGVASDTAAGDGARVTARLFMLSIGVFFIGGFLTALVSLLVPRFKAIAGIGYAEALLVQFASHASYLVFAVPITLVIVRSGYMRSIATGLGIMAVACLALAAANSAQAFALVLGALLLLSLGITFLQIAANTVVAVVGPATGSAARLTLLQGFNSLGTVLGPLLGASLLLGDTSAGAVGLPFLIGAGILAVLALAFLAQRNLLPRSPSEADHRPSPRHLRAALRDRRLVGGTAAIFAYVGAEVTIGALLVNYLMRTDILGVGPVAAGRMVSLYWGGAMVGRFVGAALLQRVSPPLVLAASGVAAALLTGVASFATGWTGAGALLAVGLCNSVMYPTIYALALPADRRAAPVASMLLCMAVVGGAVIPVLTGVAADAAGLGPALLLPAVCYLGIAAFARSCRA